MTIIKPKDDTETFSLGQDNLFTFKQHSQHPHLFATGGEERDLHVWDVTKFSDSVTETWKAKNVKNDHLDLRQPI